MNVFGRKWRLYISQPLKITNYVEMREKVIKEDAILLQDPLHINAVFEQGVDVGSEVTEDVKIDLYNLSKETLAKIQGGETIFLYAGYEQDKDLPLMYVGSLNEVESWKDGVERVTRLHCSSISLRDRIIQFNKSYREGSTTYLDILNDMSTVLKEVGIPVVISHTTTSISGNQVPLAPTLLNPYMAPFLTNLSQNLSGTRDAWLGGNLEERFRATLYQPFYFRGSIFKSLSLVCKDIGFIWYVVRGVVHIQPRKYPILQEYRTITPFNIIGHIKPYHGKSKDEAFDDNNDECEVETFLDPYIGLDTYIQLDVEGYEGTWGVDMVEHSLGYQGGDWKTKVRLSKKDLDSLPRKVPRVTTS